MTKTTAPETKPPRIPLYNPTVRQPNETPPHPTSAAADPTNVRLSSEGIRLEGRSCATKAPTVEPTHKPPSEMGIPASFLIIFNKKHITEKISNKHQLN